MGKCYELHVFTVFQGARLNNLIPTHNGMTNSEMEMCM